MTQSNMSRPALLALGQWQVAGIEIYVADPAHDEPDSLEVAAMFDVEAARLTIPAGRAQLVARVICDASNAADAQVGQGDFDPEALAMDRKISASLTSLYVRILKLARCS